MVINPVRLKLPTSVINTAVTNGNRLQLLQQLDSKTLHSVYKDKINEAGLSEEKAFYLASQSYHPLPPVQALLLRNLRT